MKGIELPISTLVIIALVLLVLLGVLSLWMSGWVGGAGSISVEAAKNSGCSLLMRNYQTCASVNPASIIYDSTNPCCYGIVDYDVNQDGTTGTPGVDTLQALCGRYYGAPTASDCRKVCGCAI